MTIFSLRSAALLAAGLAVSACAYDPYGYGYSGVSMGYGKYSPYGGNSPYYGGYYSPYYGGYYSPYYGGIGFGFSGLFGSSRGYRYTRYGDGHSWSGSHSWGRSHSSGSRGGHRSH